MSITYFILSSLNILLVITFIVNIYYIITNPFGAYENFSSVKVELWLCIIGIMTCSSNIYVLVKQP